MEQFVPHKSPKPGRCSRIALATTSRIRPMPVPTAAEDDDGDECNSEDSEAAEPNRSRRPNRRKVRRQQSPSCCHQISWPMIIMAATGMAVVVAFMGATVLHSMRQRARPVFHGVRSLPTDPPLYPPPSPSSPLRPPPSHPPLPFQSPPELPSPSPPPPPMPASPSPSPLWPPPWPPGVEADIVQSLNTRYKQGTASGDLVQAGILVHQFDDTEGGEAPWLPCPPTRWCADIGDRVSASLISAKLPYLFKEGGAGMILTPSKAEVRCSYFADGGTMSKRCGPDAPEGCVPGCCDNEGKPNWCEDVSASSQAIYQCAFRPEDFGAMLMHHEMRPGMYNEVVVDPTRWSAETTEAFYFVRPKLSEYPLSKERREEVEGFESFARFVHRKFHERYGVGTLAPLVRLELEPELGRQPFTRVA